MGVQDVSRVNGSWTYHDREKEGNGSVGGTVIEQGAVTSRAENGEIEARPLSANNVLCA